MALQQYTLDHSVKSGFEINVTSGDTLVIFVSLPYILGNPRPVISLNTIGSVAAYTSCSNQENIRAKYTASDINNAAIAWIPSTRIVGSGTHDDAISTFVTAIKFDCTSAAIISGGV
jgi:hypothetical protein